MKKRKAPNRMYLSKQLQISKYNIVGGGGGINYCLVPASTENLVTDISTEQFATFQKKILSKLISLAMY